MSANEPEKTTGIDAEYLSGHRFTYQENMAEVDNIDLDAATPGGDINWLEDVELLTEDGVPEAERARAEPVAPGLRHLLDEPRRRQRREQPRCRARVDPQAARELVRPERAVGEREEERRRALDGRDVSRHATFPPSCCETVLPRRQ